jgi:hypothetical protein
MDKKLKDASKKGHRDEESVDVSTICEKIKTWRNHSVRRMYYEILADASLNCSALKASTEITTGNIRDFLILELLIEVASPA